MYERLDSIIIIVTLDLPNEQTIPESNLVKLMGIVDKQNKQYMTLISTDTLNT